MFYHSGYITGPLTNLKPARGQTAHPVDEVTGFLRGVKALQTIIYTECSFYKFLKIFMVLAMILYVSL